MSVTYREETQLIYHLPIFLQLLIIDRILLLFVWLVYIYYRILVVYHGNSSLEFLERGTNQSWRSADIDNSMYWSQHSPLKRASNKLHDRLQCLGRGRTISFASNRQRNRNLEFTISNLFQNTQWMIIAFTRDFATDRRWMHFERSWFQEWRVQSLPNPAYTT